MTKRALRGRIVTMNDAFDVIDDGVLYVDGNTITATSPNGAPPPPDFAAVAVVDTKATLFPGLIELHNHLAYNTIGLWSVDREYADRDKWRDADAYANTLKRPTQVLASDPKLLGAITRYVECKVLFGGSTTTQGIRLNGATAIGGFFRGLVRNVEATMDPALPTAATRIPDVAARDVTAFKATLKKNKCCLLHLSEGRNDHAHKAFEALDTGDALAGSLAGIHCVALQQSDFAKMAAKGASMVWSPLSNLLLYAGTTNIKAARAEGVNMGLGPDWTFSGSKNLLGELKAARAASRTLGFGFSDRDLVAMATRNAAKILHWEAKLGSLEPGKYADVIAIDRKSSDAYDALLTATEQDVALVIINGSPRYGTATLMKKVGADKGDVDKTTVGGVKRIVCFTDDPNTKQAVSFNAAREALTDALKNVAKLEKAAMKPKAALSALAAREMPPVATLALDEVEETGFSMRPNLPLRGELTGPLLMRASKAPPKPLTAKTLDPATFADDPGYINLIRDEINLGPMNDLKEELYAAYRRKPDAPPAAPRVSRHRPR